MLKQLAHKNAICIVETDRESVQRTHVQVVHLGGADGFDEALECAELAELRAIVRWIQRVYGYVIKRSNGQKIIRRI